MEAITTAATSRSDATGCTSCTDRPCELLSLGGVFPGRFLLLHRTSAPDTVSGCPLEATSFDEIESLCVNAGHSTLGALIDDLLGQLTPAETAGFDQRTFICGFNDSEGRIAFLKALWDNGILAVVRTPVEDFNHQS